MPRKLHDDDSKPRFQLHDGKRAGWGCAPCALSIITGKSPLACLRWCLKYRRAHPHCEDGFPIDPNDWETRMCPNDILFHHEAEAFLSHFFGRKMRFKHLGKKRQAQVRHFVPALPKDRTFLLHTEEHFLVAQNGRSWDSRTSAMPIKFYVWPKDTVDAVMELPDFEIYSEKTLFETGNIDKTKYRSWRALWAEHRRTLQREHRDLMIDPVRLASLAS